MNDCIQPLEATGDYKAIELAMVPFEFDTAGRIYRGLPEYNALNDPGLPITELVPTITGITNEAFNAYS